MLTTYLYVTYPTILSDHLETIPSLSLKNFTRGRRKQPKLKFLDLTNQEALSDLNQECRGAAALELNYPVSQ